MNRWRWRRDGERASRPQQPGVAPGCLMVDGRDAHRLRPGRPLSAGEGLLMTRFASPIWLLAALLVIARVALLIRDRRRQFGAFRLSSLALVSPKLPFRARFAGLPLVLECLGA